MSVAVWAGCEALGSKVKEASFTDLGGLDLFDDLGYYGSLEDLVEQLIGGDEPMAEVKDQSEESIIDIIYTFNIWHVFVH